jgi:hypothetical protein
MSSGKRLMSLDALRGFDMLFIMGFSYLVRYVCARMLPQIWGKLLLQTRYVVISW